MRGTSQILMVLHDIMRCLILCIPLQEPNKTQNKVPQKFERTWHHRDAVPRHHVMSRQFWSKLPRHHFWQKKSLVFKSGYASKLCSLDDHASHQRHRQTQRYKIAEVLVSRSIVDSPLDHSQIWLNLSSGWSICCVLAEGTNEHVLAAPG